MLILYWMAVSLSFEKPLADRVQAVDNRQLADVVTNLMNRYRPSYNTSNGSVRQPMFSLVASVSYDKKTSRYDVTTVKDDAQAVKDKIQKCDVYVGERVVAATVLKWPDVLEQCPDGPVQWPHFVKQCKTIPKTWADVKKNCPPNTIRDGMADHAEYRTLQNIGNLVSKHNKDSDDLLVFYVLSSPCTTRCTNKTNKWNILESVKAIAKWKNYAFVFTNVFQPRGGPEITDDQQRDALKRLGDSIGLGNIYRCYKNRMECITCSPTDKNQVANPICYQRTSFKTEQSISLATVQLSTSYKYE